MSAKHLPARPSLEFYKKQAKDLLKQLKTGEPAAISRLQMYTPQATATPGLTDAQFVLAREHGFTSWPKFAVEIERRQMRILAESQGPAAAFLISASTPVGGADHTSGTLEAAERVLQEHPEVNQASIYVAAVLGDVAGVRSWLARDAALATEAGGPHAWDALTYLCFSRYLRLDEDRTSGFVEAARALLDAGANANTGWWETETGEERNFWESAIYGAAGVARNAELTRLLLDRGADPNDEETPYHIPETYDLSVLRVVLESGSMTPSSLATMLLRKADWHDADGMKLLLEHRAGPNQATIWGYTALQQAVRRDNTLSTIVLLLDHGGDLSLPNREGDTAFALAARRGRGDLLALARERGWDFGLTGVDRLLAASALGDESAARQIAVEEPETLRMLLTLGGAMLANFASTGCHSGVAVLLALGVDVSACHRGDGYYGIAPLSTALHVAAWRAWPQTARLLIDRGCPVDAVDARGQTALQLAVRACVDSYWVNRRTPEIVRDLLQAGASKQGITLPTGYDEIDVLLAG